MIPVLFLPIYTVSRALLQPADGPIQNPDIPPIDEELYQTETVLCYLIRVQIFRCSYVLIPCRSDQTRLFPLPGRSPETVMSDHLHGYHCFEFILPIKCRYPLVGNYGVSSGSRTGFIVYLGIIITSDEELTSDPPSSGCILRVTAALCRLFPERTDSPQDGTPPSPAGKDVG